MFDIFVLASSCPKTSDDCGEDCQDALRKVQARKLLRQRVSGGKYVLNGFDSTAPTVAMPGAPSSLAPSSKARSP